MNEAGMPIAPQTEVANPCLERRRHSDIGKLPLLVRVFAVEHKPNVAMMRQSRCEAVGIFRKMRRVDGHAKALGHVSSFRSRGRSGMHLSRHDDQS